MEFLLTVAGPVIYDVGKRLCSKSTKWLRKIVKDVIENVDDLKESWMNKFKKRSRLEIMMRKIYASKSTSIKESDFLGLIREVQVCQNNEDKMLNHLGKKLKNACPTATMKICRMMYELLDHIDRPYALQIIEKTFHPHDGILCYNEIDKRFKTGSSARLELISLREQFRAKRTDLSQR
jgi:hypothetical protein